MKRKFSILSILLILTFTAFIFLDVAPVLLPQPDVPSNTRSPLLLAVVTALIFALKTKIEGNRWDVLIIVPAYFIAVYHRLFKESSSSLVYMLLSSIILGIYILVEFAFPVYDFPSIIPLTGSSSIGQQQENVSCLNIRIDPEAPITLFYPTEDDSTSEDTVMMEKEFWNNMFTHFKDDYHIPIWIQNFVTSFYQKYVIKVSPGLQILNKKPMKSIIFSHGYYGTRNGYAIITKHLASLGYAVFCIEHNDVVKEHEVYNEKDRPTKRKILKRLKGIEIAKRTSKVKQVIDLILDSERLNSILGQQINLDKNSIVVMGHSYGGATAQYAAFQYPEFIKAAICLDPWLFPMPDEYLSTPCQVPLLYINSDTFAEYSFLFDVEQLITKNRDRVVWSEIKRRNAEVFHNSAQKERSFHCCIKDMNHVQQGDVCFLFPMETHIINMNRYPTRTLDFNLYCIKLIDYFLKNLAFAPVLPQVKASTKLSSKTVSGDDNHDILEQTIFTPMRKDSFAIFRQEFCADFEPQNGYYRLQFKGKSPF